MFLTRNQLCYTLIATGALILFNEQANSRAIVDTKTKVNPSTGEIATIPLTKGVNPLMGLTGITAIALGIMNKGKASVQNSGRIAMPVPMSLKSDPEAIAYAPIEKTVKKKKEKPDIVNQIAEYNRSILVSAVPGCGKTTLIRATLQKIREKTNEAAAFLIIDPKHSIYGVEDTNQIHGDFPVVSRTDTEEDCMAIIDMIDWLLSDFLVKRQKDRYTNPNPAPVYVIFDEWVVLQTKFQSRVGKKLLDAFNDRIQELILMGREDNVRTWLVGQSHQCGEIGLSSTIRASLGVIGLAAPNDTRSIDAMAGDHYLFKKQADRDEIVRKAQKLQGQRFYLSTLDVNPILAPMPELNPEITTKKQTTVEPDPWEVMPV